MNILIGHDHTIKPHTSNWTTRWIEFAKEQGHNVVEFDPLKCNHIIERLNDFDIVLWHFGQYNYAQMLEARPILYAAAEMGVKTFPDYREAWHFDDKVAEMYALQAIGAPIPKSDCYYCRGTIEQAIDNGDIVFPCVAKLRTGSGSHNVKLIKNRSQLMRYAETMFGKGFKAAPSLLYKASSNVRSSHDWATFKAKARRIPEFLRTLRGAKRFPREKSYVYIQEFIPNDGFDMKIVVVGDKCSGFCRPIRSHDFRASGGGETYIDKSRLTRQVIDSAFDAAKRLGLRCVGFDYVVDNRTGEGKIVEMSYGFLSSALTAVKGYFDPDYNWHDEPVIVEDEILRLLEKEVEAK